MKLTKDEEKGIPIGTDNAVEIKTLQLTLSSSGLTREALCAMLAGIAFMEGDTPDERMEHVRRMVKLGTSSTYGVSE